MADFLLGLDYGTGGAKACIIDTEGQVLGCNTSSAGAVMEDIDCFLFVGTGSFHPLAVALATVSRFPSGSSGN